MIFDLSHKMRGKPPTRGKPLPRAPIQDAADTEQEPRSPLGTVATTGLTDEEEAMWVIRARQGDSKAFESLLARYRSRAVRLAAHVLRRPSEAEDLTQEAFLRAFAQVGQFRGDCAFYTWLYPIVVRCCLNRMRQPGWKHHTESLSETEMRDELADSLTAEQQDTRMLVTALLDELTPPLRAALVLRELDGLDYQEIAAILDIPVGTVRSRLNAARAQFRTLWQQALKEEPHA